MKKTLILLFLPLFLSAQDEVKSLDNIDWLTNYDRAIEKANKEDKKVMLYFTGSDWCAPCKMLKKDLFETDSFEKAAKDYVLLYVDIPRNMDLLGAEQMEHNKMVLVKHNKKGVFPLFKVIDAEGKELDELSGYSMNGEVQYHLKFLEKNK